jgi:hypothetical protein
MHPFVNFPIHRWTAYLNIPDIDDEDIIIYLPKKGSSKYQDSDYKGRDKGFISRDNTWNAQEIAKNGSKVLCAMGFYSFTALIDMKPEPGATYTHSASEPYNEEQEISQERINAWMDHFGIAIVRDMQEVKIYCKL